MKIFIEGSRSAAAVVHYHHQRGTSFNLLDELSDALTGAFMLNVRPCKMFFFSPLCEYVLAASSFDIHLLYSLKSKLPPLVSHRKEFLLM